MTTYIPNPKRLPSEPVRTFSFDNEQSAEKKAIEYQSAWIYKSRYIEDLIYVYVLESEWLEKQKENANAKQ